MVPSAPVPSALVPPLSARIACAVALCCAGAAQAAAPAADGLEEVVVTATALRKPILESAQPVRVVDAQTLLRDRSASLGETLAQQPGVSATWFGPQASRPVIRGIGGERVQVYEDGGDALDASALSNDHAVTLDPLIAERVEIVRGPATLLFGNSASAGLVNVITRRIPRAASEQPFAGAFELRGNSAFDERSVAAQAEFGRGPWRMQADLQQRETGDVRIPGFGTSDALRAELAAAGEPVDEPRGRLANSASASRGGGLGVSRVGDWGYVGVSASKFSTEYEIPGPGEEEPPADETIAAARIGDGDGVFIDMNQTRYDFDAELRAPLRGLDNLRARISVNDYEHREVEPGGDVGTTFIQDGLDARVSAQHAPLAGWRGVFGLQLRDVDLQAIGAEAFVPPSQTRNAGVFVFEERSIGAVTFEAGARLESQRIDLPGASGAYDDDSLSGSASVVWRVAGDWRLTAQLASTERHPTATELFADGPHVAVRRFEIGDASLGTERAHTLDLGVRRDTDRATLSVSAFISDYSDYIFPALTGAVEDGLPVVEYRAADARFTGVEAEYALAERPGPLGEWSARLFGDYVRAEDGAGEPLPLIPPLRLGAELSLQRGGLNATLRTIWHDAQDRTAAGERPTAGFTLVDLDLAWRALVADRPMTWFVRGSNLLDEDARRHASPLKDYAPLPGRALSLGLRYEF